MCKGRWVFAVGQSPLHIPKPSFRWADLTHDRPTNRSIDDGAVHYIVCLLTFLWPMRLDAPAQPFSTIWMMRTIFKIPSIYKCHPTRCHRLSYKARRTLFIIYLYIRTKCGIRQRALSSTKKFKRRTIIARSGCAPESVELVWYLICANLMCEIL